MAQGHCTCKAAAQTEQISFWQVENDFFNPQSLQPHCDKVFSISCCNNVETLVMIWSRKGDPKVSMGKPMYHSPATIFTPTDEPSGSSKNKLLHFTVQWRETGLCVKQKFSWWPKVLPHKPEAKPIYIYIYIITCFNTTILYLESVILCIDWKALWGIFVGLQYLGREMGRLPKDCCSS